MILSFKCKDTQALFTDGDNRKWSQIARVATRRLTALSEAVELRDLRSPPGNRLELLEGKRKGQHSIRINDQWRICFEWTPQGPANVEIVDYH
ncbi:MULTISPECIES: type II toxin-antitoxin system RelE/ParE family toxin [Pseudomonas]|uniref:Plasmid maintenance system killer protein n=1 Tax=Pseudomonas oryzihabitans TaxID=47885 RepID=A0A2Z5A371_9PSED|nr:MULTISPECIES: type II toxin-antitoxin system RelE/ParE family toxin [Pseudomonas]AXA64512.1 plasmid maintenance system killer protein [Pseudomonas oryzihabitans]